MENNYYKTKESVDEYINMAKDVNSDQLIEKLKGFLPGGSRVLELGSGPGTDWELLNKYFNATGSDNSLEFLRRLKNKYPKGEFLELDAVTISTDLKFNAIYSNKVLHHLSTKDLRLSIKRQAEIVDKSGVVCHSFWKGEGNEVFKGMFVNYHTGSDLKSIFTSNFEILLIQEYMEFEEGDSIFVIGRKK